MASIVDASFLTITAHFTVKMPIAKILLMFTFTGMGYISTRLSDVLPLYVGGTVPVARTSGTYVI